MITDSNKISRVIKVAIGVAILLLLFWLTKDWWKHKVIEGLGGYTDKEIEIQYDTISKTSDTLYYKYKELLTKVDSILDRKEVNNYTHTYYIDKTNEDGTITKEEKSEVLPLVYRHENPINDTLIEGKILTIINPRDSKIIEQSLAYKPKFPIIVKEYITIQKTVTETLKQEPKPLIGFGGSLSSNSSVGVLGAYQFKNNIQIQGGYNWNLDNRADIDRPKNYATISIIKLF